MHFYFYGVKLSVFPWPLVLKLQLSLVVAEMTLHVQREKLGDVGQVHVILM